MLVVYDCNALIWANDDPIVRLELVIEDVSDKKT
jgi:hypothetical protein